MASSSIKLDGGLNLDDPRNLPEGDFSVLDNADFDPIRKRHGHYPLAIAEDNVSTDAEYAETMDQNTWVYGFGMLRGSDPSTPYGSKSYPQTAPGEIRGVAGFNDQLVSWDGWRLYTHDATPSALSSRLGGSDGAFPVVHATERREVFVPVTAEDVDMAIGRHRTLYCWMEGSTAYYSLIDNTTGAAIKSRQQLSTFGTVSQLKPIYVSQASDSAGFFFVGYNDTGSNNYRALEIAEIDDGLQNTYTVASDCSMGSVVDVRAHDGAGYFLYTDTSNALKLAIVQPGGDTSAATLDIDATISDGPVALSVHPNGTVFAVWYNTSDGADDVLAAFFVADGTRIDSIVTVASASPDLKFGCEVRALRKKDKYFGVVAVSSTFDDTLLIANVDQDDLAETAITLKHMVLTHQPFRCGDGVFVHAAYAPTASSLQHQLVSLYINPDMEGAGDRPYNVVASVFRGTWRIGNSHSWIRQCAVAPQPNVDVTTELNPSRYSLAVEVGRVLPTTTGVTQIADSAGTVEVDVLPPLRSAVVGQSLWFAGGVVHEYDGADVHEVGHLVFPEPTVLSSNGAGSLTPSSTYNYRVYAIYRNARGELHRSAAISKSVTLGGSDDTVTITIPPAPLCTVPTVQYEVYRQDPSSGTFRRAGTVTPTYANLKNTSTVYTDTASSVATGAVDPAPSYSPSGLGTLDRVAPPSCTIIGEGKDRVWFAGGSVPPRQVAYSRLFDYLDAPAWNEALVHDVPGAGDVTGLGFVGDWVTVFREAVSYVIGGAGPDNLGQGFFDPARIAISDRGCVSPDSVLLLPYGVAFQTVSGPAVLTPGLALLPVGEGVAEAFATPASSAAVSHLYRQARWAVGDDAYVLDYSDAQRPRWTRWSLSGPMTTWRGRVAVGATSVVLVEREPNDKALDDGVRGYDFAMTTGWITRAESGSRGDWAYLDFWYLDGTWLNMGPQDSMTQRVDYNFRSVSEDVRVWRPVGSYSADGGTVQDVAGSDLTATFGSGSPTWYPATFPLECRRRFSRGKGNALRFSFRTSGNGGCAINGLSVDTRAGGFAQRGRRNLS